MDAKERWGKLFFEFLAEVAAPARV